MLTPVPRPGTARARSPEAAVWPVLFACLADETRHRRAIAAAAATLRARLAADECAARCVAHASGEGRVQRRLREDRERLAREQQQRHFGTGYGRASAAALDRPVESPLPVRFVTTTRTTTRATGAPQTTTSVAITTEPPAGTRWAPQTPQTAAVARLPSPARVSGRAGTPSLRAASPPWSPTRSVSRATQRCLVSPRSGELVRDDDTATAIAEAGHAAPGALFDWPSATAHQAPLAGAVADPRRVKRTYAVANASLRRSGPRMRQGLLADARQRGAQHRAAELSRVVPPALVVDPVLPEGRAVANSQRALWR